MEKSEVSYEPGNVINDYCEPFVKCLLKEMMATHCNNCFDKTTLTRCECQMVSYCSYGSCKKTDMNNGHRIECKLWQLSEEFRDYCHTSIDHFEKLLLLRLYAQLQCSPDAIKADHPIWLPKNAPQERIEDDGMLLEVTSMAKIMKDADPTITVMPDDLLRFYHCIQMNAVTVYSDGHWSKISSAIYVELSSFEHSCKPTAAYINKGWMLQIRAIASIESSKSPTICHDYLYKNKDERQIDFKQRFGTECFCTFCVSVEDAEIDYDSLRLNLEQTTEFSNQHTDASSWPQLNQTKEDLDARFSILFHTYDPRVTQLFRQTLILAMRLKVDCALLQSLYRETGRRLLVTYGKDHPYYKTFMFSASPYCIGNYTLPPL